MREEMGEALAGRRRAAGFSQQHLAQLAGYHRSQVSHAETACRDNTTRTFWQAMDKTLKTGRYFTRWYDQMRACAEPAPRTRARTAELRTAAPLKAAGLMTALAGYRQHGWPAREARGCLELVTGTVADALEVSRPAGLVAAHWWQETGGREDAARRLPPMPPPGSSLAVIDAGQSWYFLVRAGACPWAGDSPGPPGAAPAAVTVRWHAAGSRILLPPSPAGTSTISWAYQPPRGVRLAPPLAILDLLGKAAAITRAPGTLTLPGGVIAAPAGQPRA
jgi:transcriptional regulator with XRE-family HTH domain